MNIRVFGNCPLKLYLFPEPSLGHLGAIPAICGWVRNMVPTYLVGAPQVTLTKCFCRFYASFSC